MELRIGIMIELGMKAGSQVGTSSHSVLAYLLGFISNSSSFFRAVCSTTLFHLQRINYRIMLNAASEIQNIQMMRFE